MGQGAGGGGWQQGFSERVAFKLRSGGGRKEEQYGWRKQLCKGPEAGIKSQTV